MNTPTPDPEITAALEQLPQAPAHGNAFWDELDTGLSAVPQTGSADRRGRRPFGIVGAVAAAAAVVVTGVIGIAALTGDGTTSVQVATGETTTTLLEEPAATIPPADSVQAESTTTTTTGPTTTDALAGTVDVPFFADRVVSERFHYDVGIPAGFTVVESDGRGITMQGSFESELTLHNVVAGDTDFFSSDDRISAGTELVEQTTLIIPLFENEPAGIVDRGVILEIDQWVYRGGFKDNRIVRVYNFADRSIRAELTWNTPAAGTFIPMVILDDIRMFNAALNLPECSSFGLDPRPAPPGLNEAQSTTYARIMQALSTCDWAEFDSLVSASPDGFSASFGGDEAPDLWRNYEAYGSDVMERLHTTLGLELAISDTDAVWPKAFTQNWDDVSDASKAELREAGYDESSFEFFADIGFTGYRAGIDAAGNWTFFIAGD